MSRVQVVSRGDGKLVIYRGCCTMGEVVSVERAALLATDEDEARKFLTTHAKTCANRKGNR